MASWSTRRYSAHTGGSPVIAYGPLFSGCMVWAASIGMALASAASTCVQLTTPGDRFRLTSSALRAERGRGGIIAVGNQHLGVMAGPAEHFDESWDGSVGV